MTKKERHQFYCDTCEDWHEIGSKCLIDRLHESVASQLRAQALTPKQAGRLTELIYREIATVTRNK